MYPRLARKSLQSISRCRRVSDLGLNLSTITDSPKRACRSERSEESEGVALGFYPQILRCALNDTTRWLLLACCLLPFSGYAQTSASAILNRPVVETGDTFTLPVLVGGTNVEPKKVAFAALYATAFFPEKHHTQQA